MLGIGLALAGLGAATPGLAQHLSFPGAEGAGRFVSGGRCRAAVPTTVFEVTSLSDANVAGTLRYALSQPASAAPSRTVVFRVCGTIHLTARLSIPANTTLAGQTAPGDGICLADRQVQVSGNNVVVRFVRFRLGDRYPQESGLGMTNGSSDEDAFDGIDHKNIIVDHCTMSWSEDEAFTFYGAATDSMTLQWNLISEPLNYAYHFETGDTDYERHGYGGIWGGRRASFHHNLFAQCSNRTPRWDGTRYGAAVGSENCDFRNNVIYDWGSNNVYGGEGGNYNLVNNYLLQVGAQHQQQRALKSGEPLQANHRPAPALRPGVPGWQLRRRLPRHHGGQLERRDPAGRHPGRHHAVEGPRAL